MANNSVIIWAQYINTHIKLVFKKLKQYKGTLLFCPTRPHLSSPLYNLKHTKRHKFVSSQEHKAHINIIHLVKQPGRCNMDISKCRWCKQKSTSAYAVKNSQKEILYWLILENIICVSSEDFTFSSTFLNNVDMVAWTKEVLLLLEISSDVATDLTDCLICDTEVCTTASAMSISCEMGSNSSVCKNLFLRNAEDRNYCLANK